MAKKTVIHIFHDDADSIAIGSRLAQRMLEIAADEGIEVEIFGFGPAQRRLTATDTGPDDTFNRQIDELIAAGVHVGAGVDAARTDGASTYSWRGASTCR